MYTTYAYVGSVADGYARDTYTAEQVQNLTAEVVRMADVSIEHLEAVGETEIVDTDKKAIEGIVEILKLLKQEAAALSTFSRTQAQADLDEYEGVRTTVWPKIRAMLGLE